MEARATAKYIRVSPQKARLVIDLIRGKNAGEAMNILHFTKKRVTREIEKVLRSAISNAEQKSEKVDVDRLFVSRAYVNDAPDRKSTRLNSSHGYISYAVFCLKKKKKQNILRNTRCSASTHHTNNYSKR